MSQSDGRLSWAGMTASQPVCPECGKSEFKVVARAGRVLSVKNGKASVLDSEVLVVSVSCANGECGRDGREFYLSFEERDWFAGKAF